MDYSTVESEVMETLDFLRPPVKRIFENNSRERTVDRSGRTRQNKVEILRDYRKKIPKNSHFAKIKKTIQSSTSLILKKTSEREILERYSVVSYTNFIQPAATQQTDTHYPVINKPLINITVTPKTELQAHTGKLYRKGRHSTKRVQSTSSYHENSIRTKKLYLVVAGRKNGKVYEVKTTGSAKFSSDQIKKYDNQDEEYPIKDISNVKQIIKSLNMDKKKKKNKKNRNFDEECNQIHECKCLNAVNDSEVIDVEHRKSRVRIYGRVGRTEDDRYVLKCGATVNDEPIANFATTERRPSPTFFRTNDVQPKFFTNFNTVGYVSGCSKNDRFSKPIKDSNIQVDFRNDNPYNQQQDVGKVSASKESQGTQVNFINDLSPVEIVLPAQKANQIVQCNCTSIENMQSTSNNRIHSLKESQSPLVIISVYPKQESFDIAKTIKNNDENTRRPQRTNFNNNHKNTKWENNDVQINQNRTSIKPTFSRSPSPPIRTANHRIRQDRHDVETKILRTKLTTENSNRQSTVANINRKSHQFQNNKPVTNIKLKQTDKKAIDLKNQQTQRFNCTNKKAEVTKKPNTELKKAIVDDYTKRITAKMDHKSPKNDISNVKVNIDGDNEYYDVHFQQGRLRTDLHIKKTLKEAGSQKHYDDIDSLENLFLIPEKEPRKRPLSNTVYNNPVIDAMGLGNRTSRLKLRDSIEIFHRRENVHNVKDTQTHQSVKRNEYQNDNIDFLVPIKHYKGDQCELPNPIKRDKEIRELLGIENRIPYTPHSKNIPRATFGNVVEDCTLLHCVYKRKCEKNITTGISLNSIDCGCCDKKKPNCYAGANTKVNASQCESAVERTSLYQQLILNRNVQVFLQVEQFCKQKPIVLSRKQYDKVKKTIQRTLSKNQDKRKKEICKCSMISVGEVKKRTKPDIPENRACGDKQTQTNKKEDNKSCRQDHATNEKKSERLKISIEKKIMSKENTNDFDDNKKVVNEKNFCAGQEVETLVLFDTKEARCSKRDENKQCVIPARQVVSSMEIHYASMAFMKQVTFSAANVGSLSSSIFGPINNRDSLHTIFKGHKKSPTPNLGTSVYSLVSDGMKSDTRSIELLMDPCDSKPKKPFLRRLMSCLVMRSRTSDVKIISRPVPQPPSVNSSIDSYHISTSLGAIEVTSSMYDTSASFYSNHTILPIENNKMKRSFFSSVRGFITNRKS